MRKVQLIVNDREILFGDYENITPLLEDIDNKLSEMEWNDAIIINDMDEMFGSDALKFFNEQVRAHRNTSPHDLYLLLKWIAVREQEHRDTLNKLVNKTN